jgi:hypothetical protein
MADDADHVSAAEQWVVKLERYDPPSFVRLFGPFRTAEAANEWLESAHELGRVAADEFESIATAGDADVTANEGPAAYTVVVRIKPPGKLADTLDELRRNRQIP